MRYILDVDGTLVEPHGEIDDDMLAELDSMCEDVGTESIYLLSGATFDKMRRQLCGAETYASVLFTELGNVCTTWDHERGGWTERWRREGVPGREVVESFLLLREASPWEGERAGRYVETRSGMINLSVVGRDCSEESRQAYSAWDREHRERLGIVDALRRLHPECVFTLGGAISVDATLFERTKAQILADIRQSYTGPLTLVADGMIVGNDAPLAWALWTESEDNRLEPVRSRRDTLAWMRRRRRA